MFMDDKLYKNKNLNSNEKLALNYILKGHLRIKFIPIQKLGEEIHLSRQSAYKIMENLEKKEYIIRPLIENRYFMTIITNKCIFDNCDEFIVQEPNFDKIKDEITREIAMRQAYEFKKHKENEFAEFTKAKKLFDRLYSD